MIRPAARMAVYLRRKDVSTVVAHHRPCVCGVYDEIQ
jgi:hypothetical protein